MAATNNENKLKEFRRILQPYGVEVTHPKELGLIFPEVEENGLTFEENAELKAVVAMELTGLLSIGDDSGLLVNALGGRPGIYSARYASTAEQRIEKLLGELKGIPKNERGASFVCSICCAMPDGTRLFTRAEYRGSIALAPSGTGNFGYDPIFVTADGRTVAELTPEQKDQVSARGKALVGMIKKLKQMNLENMRKKNDNK